ALQASFAELGHDAPIVTDPALIKGWAVALGANLLPRMSMALPDKLILYNLEQVQPVSNWFMPEYPALLKRYPVWDYSRRNIARLKAGGINAALCGVGYMPVLTRIAPAPVCDIDVLFVGSLNDRRKAVLEKIAQAGKKVKAAFNVYGTERDALIARAKIVLNLHFYEAQVFEIIRVSYLLANRACVVSETGQDAELEAPLRDGVAFAPYDKLTDTCLALLSNDTERTRLAGAGFAKFSAMPQTPMLRVALSLSIPSPF
ncbi:MAG: hypothetical protein KGJ21_09540, partial [Pseudomonadota bacterium]|nr:hypothetical protein [Pseudomonadota bacterium]